jgi:hypothetical protein
LIRNLQVLLEKYSQKEKCGIFFNLNETKNPLDIIGVLDFLKFKIQDWGNTNIYSYRGILFNENIVMVVGSNTIEAAINIIIFVYLSRLGKKDPLLVKSTPEFNSSRELEEFLKNELELKIAKGYPENPFLELELKNHLNKLLND